MNHAPFDIRAMKTFGVSAKEIENPIGYFGTGFRYGVAIVLRLGGRVNIFSNGENYVFTTKQEEIRGKTFNIVCMNGEEINFTTHLGVNWEPWMAFREFYCNCKDENGVTGTEDTGEYGTVVHVECPEIYDAYIKKDIYFLDTEKLSPIAKTAYVEIYNRPSHHIYYQGICVANSKQHMLYTYNLISKTKLTEDRTLADIWGATSLIKDSVQNALRAPHLRKVILADKDTYEGNIDYSSAWGVSDEFLECVLDLKAQNIGVRENIRQFIKEFKPDVAEFTDITLSNIQEKQLGKAVSFLCKMDIPVKEFPIRVVNGLGNGVLGRALDGEILISDLAFNMGTKQLTSALLEEWVHLKYNVADFDRAMQNWLFDKVLSLGEEMIGEPI